MLKNAIGFLLLIITAIAYLNIPIEWRRHKDIEHGNKLIQNIQIYQQQHNRLPENSEIETLNKLGFTQNARGWQPAYQKQNEHSYRIIYLDGYTPPYLYWQSDEKIWTTSNY